jgi:hypothetical protein
MTILIPTRGRINRQVTKGSFHLDQLDQGLLSPLKIIYVVPECDYSEFCRVHGMSKNIMRVPDSYGISDIRQSILDNVDDDKCVVIDDDVQLMAAVDSKTLRKATVDDAKQLFYTLEAGLDTYAYLGLLPAAFHSHYDIDGDANGRILNLHAYRRDIIRGEGLRYDDVEFLQDCHMVLSLLELGYENRVLNRWCLQSGNFQEGGCSVRRTPERSAAARRRLAELHPGVTVYTKTRFIKEGEADQTGAEDVRIQWKRSLGTKAHLRKLP